MPEEYKGEYPEQFAEFREILEGMISMAITKSNDYGSDNIGYLGERGVYVRLWDKVARLKRLLWDNREVKVKDESIDDTLMDLANYAVIMLILRRGKWGK